VAIVLRCSDCHKFWARSTVWCSCGSDLRARRSIYFRRKVDGRRHFHNCGDVTLRQADALYETWLLSLKSPGPVVNGEGGLTLQDLAEQYLGKLRGGSYYPTAKIFYERLREAWGDDFPVDQVTTGMCRDYQQKLRCSALSLSTVDRHISSYKAAWNYCLPDEVNPWRRVKPFNPDNVVMRYLTDEQESRLLAAARNLPARADAPRHFWAILVLATRTALRKRNILDLSVDETDFSARVIRVKQKGGRTHNLPMSDEVYRVLEEIRPESGFYFLNPKTGRPFQRIGKTFSTVKTAAGISKEFRYHDLRHSAATKLLKATGNLKLTARVLGHSSTRVTERYAHVLDDDLRAAVEVLSGGGQPRVNKTQNETAKVLKLRRK